MLPYRGSPRGGALTAVAVTLAVTLAAAGVWVSRPDPGEQPTASPAAGAASSVTVDPAGGTYHLSGFTITALPGTVTAPTLLTVGAPRRLGLKAQAPLARASRGRVVQFDVALAGGLQPRKPLGVAVSLAGPLLPEGAKPEQALLYSTARRGTGFELLAATTDPGGVLRAKLRHLSSKYVTYLDPAVYAKSIADNLLPPGIGRERPPECLDEISSRSAGKVRLGAAAGWSNGRSSTVHPCLELSKGRVSLKVINNSYIFWQVASSTGTTIRTVPGDIDAEMVKLIAGKIGADPGTQEYLARASELTVELPAEALPSRTELKSSTGTFLAEALWIALNVVVSIATGRQVPAAVKLAVDFVKTYIRPLLELTGIVGCMQKAVKLAQGKGATSEALSDLFDVFTSQCAQLIDEALADRGTQVVPASFWSSQLAVLGALKKAGDSLVAGVAGQYQQGFPPVRITVNGNDFRLFVGTWRVHGSTVTIRADRTGLMDWNAGPCQDLLQHPGGPHCQGYANLRFGPVQGRVLTAQVTGDVYYRTWDTNELYRDPVASRNEPIKAGLQIQYRRITPHVLHQTWVGHPADQGNPYLCAAAASEAWHTRCNA